MKISHSKGFTLIETMVYLALYAIIMTGALVSVYAIFGSSARNQTKAMVQEEGSFLIGKTDWALSGTQSIALPPANSSGDILQVTKYDTTVGNPVVITCSSCHNVSGGNMYITRGGITTQLNNSNVKIICPVQGCFTHTSASGDGINPENATSSFTVSTQTSEGLSFSQDFSTVKYLRK